jgi:hypothetical protein
MHIVEPSQLQTEARSWIANIVFLAAVASLAAWVFWPFSQQEEGWLSSRVLENRSTEFSLESIGYGPLALNGVRTINPVPNLARELSIMGRNSRPDAQPGEVALLLGLKSTQQEQVSFSGQKIYLEQKPQDTFLFAPEKTSLAMTPIAMKDGSILIEIELNEKKGRFFLKDSSKKSSGQEETSFAKELRSGKWWGPDIFLQNYGGEEFKSISGKQKVEFPNSLCFVSEGDYLTWEDGQWRVAETEAVSPFFPMARVTSVSHKGVEIRAWDETGFHPVDVEISASHLPRPNYKLEELISSIRSRTSNELSCLLGKRRVVLRAGDWWLKTETGWRHLRNLNDIEDYLAHKIRGELFIFESVSMERGKAEVKGQFFDTMRTQMQPIALTLAASEKKSTALARKTSRGASGAPFIAKTEEKQTRLQIPQYQSSELEEKKTP